MSVLKLRFMLLLQQHDLPPVCTCTPKILLCPSLFPAAKPPLLVQSAASSMSASSTGSRTQTGLQLMLRLPGLHLKTRAVRARPREYPECWSRSLMVDGGVFKSLFLQSGLFFENLGVVRSPKPRVKFFSV